MNLVRKTLLIIASLLAFQFLGFYLSSRFFFLRNFTLIEEQYARRNLDRALAFLESQEQNLMALAKDWAAWDDTYDFIQTLSEEYISSNLVDETFEDLGLNLMLFINSSGEFTFSKAYDLELHREMPLPEGLEEYFYPGSPLLIHSSPKEGKVGLIALPSGPMLVALHPIVTSKLEGPIMGTFIIGYYLNETWAERLSKAIHFPVSFLPPFGREEAPVLDFTDSGTVEAFGLLKDLYGKPALAIKITMPRTLYRQSLITFYFFSFFNLLIGFMFGGAILLFLRHNLLSRLLTLSEEVSNIALSGDVSGRVTVKGKDELAQLGKGINDFLASLEASQRKLEENEKWYRLLINSITDGLWVVDRDLTVREINETGARFLGVRVEELIGKSLKDCLREPAFSDFYEAFSRALSKNAIYTVSIIHQTAEGEKNLEVRLYPLPNGALCIARDVSEMKQMERLYLRAQKMEAAGRVALAIAHDFKNFLTPIMAGIELLLSGNIPLHESRVLLEEIRNSCEKASDLVKQLLLFGRPELLAPEVIDLNGLIKEMEGLIIRTLGSEVKLVLELSPQLFPIRANRRHIEQILINLVINAKEAMPSGGQLTIRTENINIKEALAHPEAYPGIFVCLTVADTGIGMTPEMVEHAFEPFFTTKGTGVGLGLSVVYSIVKQNKGWIEVKSELGKGSAFYLYFPALDGGTSES